MEALSIVLPTWLGIVIGIIYVIERLYKIGFFRWLSQKLKQLCYKCYLFFFCKNNPIIAENKQKSKQAFWQLQAMTGRTKHQHKKLEKQRNKIIKLDKEKSKYRKQQALDESFIGPLTLWQEYWRQNEAAFIVDNANTNKYKEKE